MLGEIDRQLHGAEVVDVARLREVDDLLVFVLTEDSVDGFNKHALHVAPGGHRARVTVTRRRFGKGRVRDLAAD